MKINMKTKLSFSLLVCTSALIFGAQTSLAWDGKEVKEPISENNVYQISSAEELAWLAQETNSGKEINAVLIEDIDLESYQWTPIGANTNKASSFKGNFNGNNFSIKGFNIKNGNGWSGLFGKNEGTIANFSLEGSLDVGNGNGSGSIVGWNAKTVDNVSSAVEVTARTRQSVGGLVGQSAELSSITNSEFKGTVSSSSQHIGGIVGKSMSGNIIGNINYGDITGPNGTSQARIAGIAGTVELTNPTVIANNINYGAITSDSSNAYLAGIIGYYNNRSSYGAKDKHLFFNSINFGEIVGENAKEIDQIINNTERTSKDDMYLSKNLFDTTDDKFNLEKAIKGINEFDGSAFESPITISDSAKFHVVKDGSVKLTSQLNRSKEEPIDEEKVKAAEEYINNAITKLNNSFYKYTPVFGQDNNINAMVEKGFADKGFPGIKVSVKDSSDEEYIAKDGTIHYYYKSPNQPDGTRFKSVKVSYELTKDGAVVDFSPKSNAVIHWDRDKLEKVTKEEIADKLTLNAIKDQNEFTEKFDKDLILPKFIDNKRWGEISWKSSNPDVLKIDNSLQIGSSDNMYKPFIGKIKPDITDQEVLLTASIKNNQVPGGQPDLVVVKEINVTIKGLGEESKSDIQNLMDQHYTIDKIVDAITRESVDSNNVVNDIGLPNPKGTGVPQSHSYKFTAKSNTPEILTINGYRGIILRPLPGEKAKKASLTVTMEDRNSNLKAEKTFDFLIQPLTQKEINDEIKLMEAVKENYFNGLNKENNTDKSNVTKKLNAFQQASFNDDGETINWVYDQKDLKDKGIIPVSIDETKPSEQWDRFHSSNNTILQHENLVLSQPKYDTRVTIKSVLSSSIFSYYAKAYPDNSDFQKLYRQPVSTDLIVKGKEGENPNPEEKRKVSFSIIGENINSSYTNWLTTTGEGDEYTSVFDLFKKIMDDNGYTFVGSNYISSITNSNGVTLAQKEQGPNSGWMYAVNGVIVDKMPADYMIEDGDKITWFYVVDYLSDPRIKNNQFTPDLEIDNETDLEIATRLINAIGEVTLEKEAVIKEAREALDKVSTINQEYLSLNKHLEAIESKLLELKVADENQKAAEIVINLINNIGEINLSSEEAITNAMNSYEKLAEEAKFLVTNIDILENAKNSLAQLIADRENQEAASILIKAIDNLVQIDLANKAEVELTRTKFDSLTTEQQTLVTNIDILENAELTILTLTNEVNKIVNEINELPETITLAEKEIVTNILNSYSALPESSKAFVLNLTILEKAQNLIIKLDAVKPVEDLINAIGEVSLTSEQSIEDARKAFDSLSDELKQSVLNLEILENAEAKLKELKLDDLDNTEKALKIYKENAIKELEIYKDIKKYRKEQQKEIASILRNSTESITNAIDTSTIDQFVKNAKFDLDQVKTDKDLSVNNKTPQGPWIKDSRYVTIRKKGYNTWTNFNWKKRQTSNELLNVTYESRGKYNHKNGDTYLSLFDEKGKWFGYINEKATVTGNGKQGAYIEDGRYVTLTNANYDTWSNFSWKKRQTGKSLLNQTFEARGHYNHINGQTYLSLFDGNGKWFGYINKKAVKIGNGKQGAYTNYGHKVTINKKGYNTWSNFNWKKRQSTNQLLGKTFIAKGKYTHINGSTYYSLYDNKGKWFGYINENAIK